MVRRRWLTGAVLMLGGVAALAAPEAPVILTVQADRPGARISPLLYGVFFEEINHAGDGGLYGELAFNGALRETREGKPVGWSRGKLESEADLPALRLDAESGRIVAVNEGYWGIPLKKRASYRLSLSARKSADMRGPLSVSLEGEGGQVYAQARLSGLSTQWRRFSLSLKSRADDPRARLVFSARASGSVWLRSVSLFPVETWRRRPGGLRRDLAELVAALKPGFVRFPGGCYVEGGERLEDAFRWKATLGDPALRAGHQNAAWGYRSSDGLGFHEYLRWCEDLGAEPVFVVNAGFSHSEVVPMDRLGPWIDDALDAVEYANGPASSRWGALRASAGHPRPFNLRFIEIGNENGTEEDGSGAIAQYAERYRRFYDAIKARYPGVRIISDAIVPHPLEIVDEHYYDGPEWFWANTGRYDRYDRKGPKIFVGEYAVKRGRGALGAALAEAAFMTGLERNADVVAMASYAPLLVNVNDRKWSPDAIVFDGARSCGTPSYYVQKLFAENRADAVVPLSMSGAPLLAGVAGVADESGEIILKVVNGADAPRPAKIEVRGAAVLRPVGRSFTLTSESLEDENTLERPESVAPRSGRIDGVGPTFSFIFPARSVTVLRLKRAEAP